MNATAIVQRGGGLKLREHAYINFTDRLLAGEIQPGQFVSQRELVDLTGFPLGAIRELVPRLEADGLIKTVPQRGMQVAHIDLQLIDNAFQLRLFLEREAVMAFTRSVSDQTMTRIRRDHEAALEEAKQKVTPDLLDRAQDVDWGLHDLLIDRLDNPLIANVYRVNSIKIRLIRKERTRITSKVLISVLQEHVSILGAIESRDPDRAATAIESHIKSAKARALGM